MKLRPLSLPSIFGVGVFSLLLSMPEPVFANSLEMLSAQYLADVNTLIRDSKSDNKNIRPEVYKKFKARAKNNSRKTYSPERMVELEAAAKKAKDKEQSRANKMLGGLTMLATGIGGMQLAQGMSEMRIDRESADDMEAYLLTIKCGIAGSRNVNYGSGATAPETTRQFGDARLEYTTLAGKIKKAKTSLGMPPGMESEFQDLDTSSLYQGRGMDEDGISNRFDTAAERAAEDGGKKRAITGGAVAGAGVLGGVVGNSVINKEGGIGGGLGGNAGGIMNMMGSMGGK